MKNFVTYHRISNDKSGGLDSYSIEAQQEITKRFCAQEGGEIAGSFCEVESGTLTAEDRPELAKAIALARKTKSCLVFSRIDRLARNAEFLLRLQSSGVEIRFCDMPSVQDRFTIGILALVAEQEARNVSVRTKIALQRAKASGVKLGGPELGKAREAAAVANKARKAAFASAVVPIIREIEAAGVKTLEGICRCLTARGIRTQNGGQWYAKTVANILATVTA